MISPKLILAVATLAVMPGMVHAQEPRALDDLDADRLDASQVRIEFEYTGGVCEEVGTAELGDVVDGTLSVTVPTVNTAEVCTLQAVEIEVEQVIEADENVTHVEVTLLAPDGSVMATGTDRIDRD